MPWPISVEKIMISELFYIQPKTRFNASALYRYTYNNDIALLKLNMTKDDQFFHKKYITVPKTYQIDVRKQKLQNIWTGSLSWI